MQMEPSFIFFWKNDYIKYFEIVVIFVLFFKNIVILKTILKHLPHRIYCRRTTPFSFQYLKLLLLYSKLTHLIMLPYNDEEEVCFGLIIF